MNKQATLLLMALPLLVAISANAQNNFPNGLVASKGTSGSGSGVFIGTELASHFQYSTTEDTYIRGGKSTSNVYINDVGAAVHIGNGTALVYTHGILQTNNGLSVYNGLNAVKGTVPGGSAIFHGSSYASHFHYSTNEDTYIRGGKPSSNVFINDVGAKVVIGNVSYSPTGYKLFVEQGILTEKVKVALRSSTDWADHVFNKDYPLMPLKQVEAFVQSNKHLPGVPSAQQLMNDGGVDITQMLAKQMEKIEELTLHIIALNKRLEQLEAKSNR
ncbi:MAG: hypothetical protein JNM68_04715 [Dinghuibacter sp.]|nr:hypothetical protein [Dinghuibacter sp.]